MKWALIYILGTAGTFETGLTFNNYVLCFDEAKRAMRVNQLVHKWAKDGVVESALGTYHAPKDVKEFVKLHPLNNEESVRVGFQAFTGKQEDMYRHGIKTVTGGTMFSEASKDWDAEHEIVALCLPTK